MDASASAIAYARALPHVEGLSYLVSEMLRAPQALGAASVDVAHASRVLHHLEDAAVVQALRLRTIRQRLQLRFRAAREI